MPSIPALLPDREWALSEDGKRAAHDEERLQRHSRLVVVRARSSGRIVKRGGDLIRMTASRTTGGPG